MVNIPGPSSAQNFAYLGGMGRTIAAPGQVARETRAYCGG